MKRMVAIVLTGWLAAGCATSTIEKRKAELYGAYASLPSEMKTAVDQGQIKVGMTSEAVYIAWGKPAQVLTNASSEGTFTIWLYQDSRLNTYRYWNYWSAYPYPYGDYCWRSPYLVTGYYPEEYVSAEVVFEADKVRAWRTLPVPPR